MPDVLATARGIVLHNNHILLIERHKRGSHYFSIPGGRMEPGETPEMACVREIFEETSIDALPTKEVFTLIGGDPEHHIYLCEYVSGEPQLGLDTEEYRLTQGGEDTYEPKWIPLDDLPALELAPSFTKLLLLNALKNGFPDDALIHVERNLP
jgi:ADP-ribose pyrophosphatase YjhB (NUDIX family)